MIGALVLLYAVDAAVVFFLEDLAKVSTQAEKRRGCGSLSNKFVHNRRSSQSVNEQAKLVL
jgi:hypothetical protein